MGLSILLVEDDPTSRELLAGILPKRFPQVTVHNASDGRTGLALFSTHRPDIVITDINMPDMNGMLMTERIRAIKPAIRLIVVTADSGSVFLQAAAERGFRFDHLVEKPIVMKELFAAVEACLKEVGIAPLLTLLGA